MYSASRIQEVAILVVVIAWFISSRVFITKGPYLATGSLISGPARIRNSESTSELILIFLPLERIANSRP